MSLSAESGTGGTRREGAQGRLGSGGPYPTPWAWISTVGTSCGSKTRHTLIHVVPLPADWLSGSVSVLSKVIIKIQCRNTVPFRSLGHHEGSWASSAYCFCYLSCVSIPLFSRESHEYWGGLGSPPGKKPALRIHSATQERSTLIVERYCRVRPARPSFLVAIALTRNGFGASSQCIYKLLDFKMKKLTTDNHSEC